LVGFEGSAVSVFSTLIRLSIVTVALLQFLLAAVPVWAADVRVLPGDNGKPNVVILSGDLVLGDQKKFISQTLSLDAAIVLFESRGGNLVAGIEIGKAIRLKDFVTYVPADTICASACAFAWLGGTKRLLSRSAKVGFHAVSINEGGVSRESGMGNAIAGAYLNQLGLPTRAVTYITAASPDDMRWLTIADAGRVGIEASVFDPQTPQISQSPTNTDRPIYSTPAKPKVTSAPPEPSKQGNSGKPTAIDKINDWGVYKAGSGNSRTCYILAEPISKNPRSLKRNPSYIFVTFRPAERVDNEVSIVAGANMMSDAGPIAEMGSTFPLIARGSNLWLKNASEEDRFVNSMRRSPRLSISGQTINGVNFTDTYNLAGSGAALDLARHICR
jgi:hypothetical protein